MTYKEIQKFAKRMKIQTLESFLKENPQLSAGEVIKQWENFVYEMNFQVRSEKQSLNEIFPTIFFEK